MGNKKSCVPWGKILNSSDILFDKTYLPPEVNLTEPSKLKKS